MRFRTAALAVLLVPVLNVAVLACPMCKDSIAGDEESSGTVSDPSQMGGGGLPRGFNVSVYLMLAGFMGTLGLVSWTLVKGVRGSMPGAPGFPVRQVPPKEPAASKQAEDTSTNDEAPPQA